MCWNSILISNAFSQKSVICEKEKLQGLFRVITQPVARGGRRRSMLTRFGATTSTSVSLRQTKLSLQGRAQAGVPGMLSRSMQCASMVSTCPRVFFLKC